MTDVYVSTQGELLSALSSATGGETIILKNGDYGSLDIVGAHFSEYVTLSSEAPLGARFSDIDIVGSSYIRIDGVHVQNASNGGAASALVAVRDGSSHIQFLNSEVNGRVDDVYDGWFGLYTKDVSDVLFHNNYVHDVKRGGVFYTAERLEVSENVLDYIGDDGFKFIGVHNVLIENNTGARYVYPEEGAHLDFIQFQGQDSSSIVVRGNISLPANAVNIQGIFFDDAHYTDVLIEQNIIATGMIRGISVSSGTNVLAQYNTVVHLDGTLSKAAKVMVGGGDSSIGNIQTSYPGESGEADGNLTIQHTDPTKPYYYDDVFASTTAEKGINLQDLAPISGSLAEYYGAFERLAELLGGTPTTEVEVPLETDQTDTTLEPSSPSEGLDESSVAPDPVTSPEPSLTPISYNDYTLDGYIASATELHRKTLIDDAHVVQTTYGPMIRLDGDGDYVNLGRLKDMEKSDQLSFSISFKQSADHDSQAPLVSNAMRMGFSVEDDGISFQIATADEGFKTFKVDNLGLNDSDYHTAYVSVDAAADRLQIIVDNQLVLDVSDTDFAFVNASPREWGWTLGGDGSDSLAGDVGTFRIDDVSQFFEIYSTTADSDLAF